VDLTDSSVLAGNATEAVLLRQAQSELKEYALKTGGVYVSSPQGEKLDEAFTNVVEELRNQYTLTYYSTNEKRDGKWRKISAALNRGGLNVRARKGYYGPKQ
jgi:VWFA-related protein